MCSLKKSPTRSTNHKLKWADILMLISMTLKRIVFKLHKLKSNDVQSIDLHFRDIEPPYIVTNNTQILTLSIYLCFSTPCLSHHCSLSPLQPNCSTLMPVNNVRYKIDNTKFSHKLLWIDFKLLLGINMYYHYTKTPLNTWTIMSQKTQGFSISHRSNFRN